MIAIIGWIISTLFTVYLIGWTTSFILMFAQPDHKFGRWWEPGIGINWGKAAICAGLAILWPMYLLPDPRK